MLPIGDKPIIQHILEELVRHGISSFDIILHEHPELVEKYLQDGNRWGVSITYHLTKDPAHPFSSVIANASRWPETTVLICSGKQLINLHGLQEAVSTTDKPIRIVTDGHSAEWMHIPTSMLNLLDSHSTVENLEAMIDETVEIPIILSVNGAKALLSSNQRVLERKVPRRFQPTPTMADEGVWIGRGVTIHPTAEIQPPVYIGPDTQIHAQTRIGPNAVIESDCLLDSGSTVADAVILSNTFIGEGLDVHDSIVDRHQLVNVALQTTITSTEDHILSDLARPTLKRLFNQLLERCIATFLVILFSPIIAFFVFRYGTHRTPIVHLPTTLAPVGWRLFDWISLPKEKNAPRFIRWLVELMNIVRGNAHFIGLPPRGEKQLEELDRDWKARIISSKIGTITPGEAYGQDLQNTDQQFATESLYAVQMRYRSDLKLLLMFLWKAVTNKGQPDAK